MPMIKEYSIKVSVCVPIYKVAAYIERCVRSLFEQTMQEGIEFIFVNDCTPDDSVTILQNVLLEYPHRKANVKIIHHDINQGLVAARQTALKHARGEYIIHCDSDDWVDLNYYEAMYHVARVTQADIVYSSYFQDDNKDVCIPTLLPAYVSPIDLLNDILGNNLHWNVWAKMVHHRIAQSPDLVIHRDVCFGEDLLLSTQMIARAQSVAYCEVAKYHYFCQNTNSYTRTFSRASLDQLMRAVQTLQTLLPEAVSLTGCQGEILFKAVFYHLMTAREFHAYAKGLRKRILTTSTLSLIKRLILFNAFISYRWTAGICKILQKFR